MKKTLIILSIIILLLCITKEEKIIIPKDSIRFRVIANSNDSNDQQLKKKIVNNLSKELVKINNSSIKDTRKSIKEKLPLFTDIVDKTLKENNSDKVFNINYGKNYFPEKTYKNVVYEEGEYESLVVKLGEGKGKNFWCVLFPPLCFVDEENKEYKSIIKELIDKYF